MPDLVEYIGAVNLGGFVTFRIYGGNRRYIDDRIVTDPFPRVERADDDGPDPGYHVNVDRLRSKEPPQIVQNAGFVVKNVETKGTHNYPGNEVGKKDNGLAELLDCGSGHDKKRLVFLPFPAKTGSFVFAHKY
jgi:hypothetical protein